VAETESNNTKRFDLTLEAERFSKNVGALRYFVAAALVAVLGTIVDLIVTQIASRPVSAVWIIAIGLVVLLSAVAVTACFLAFRFLSPSATSVEIDSEGLILTYASSRAFRLRWKSPTFRLRLDRLIKESTGIGNQPPKEQVTLWSQFAKQNWINFEVLESIVAAAENHGLSIERRPATLSNSSGKWSGTRFVISASRS
jgi:hypothetical protein